MTLDEIRTAMTYTPGRLSPYGITENMHYKACEEVGPLLDELERLRLENKVLKDRMLEIKATI